VTQLPGEGNGKRRSRSLRDDSQKGKSESKRRSRFPEGMTERKARAKAECMDVSAALRSGLDDGVVG